jgi:hypothetical protein
MNPEDTQMLGIVLTIVGVAFAIIGYVIYLNLRAGKSENEEEEAETSAAEDAPDWAADLSEEVLVRAFPEEKAKPDADPIVSPGPSSSPSTPQPGPVSGSMISPEYLTVATILRQADSGELKIQVNDKEYSSVDQLRMTEDWPKINRMSKDLLNWLDAKPSAQVRKTSTPVDTSADATANDGDNMISQINSILEGKVKDMDSNQSSIRLVEGTGGVLKVYVGVESFLLDEVPYENVQELIRESVAEWEATQ